MVSKLEKTQLLEALSDGSWHTLEDLSRETGLRDDALAGLLEELSREVPELRRVPGLGICLPRELQRYDRRMLEALAGGRVDVYDTIGSTNDAARELFEEGAPHGTSVLSDKQTAGRGRLGRVFVSPSGTGIYLSVLLTDPAVLENAHLVTPAAAVVAAEILEQHTRAQLGIKWVNDLFCGGKKVSGILTEAVIRDGKPAGIIVGTGINFATPPELLPAEVAGSLRDFLRPGASRNEVAAAMVREMRDRLPEMVSDRSFLPGYRRRSILLGRDIWVCPVGQEPYPALAESIDEDAALVICRNGRKIRLQTGEVSIRLPEQLR